VLTFGNAEENLVERFLNKTQSAFAEARQFLPDREKFIEHLDEKVKKYGMHCLRDQDDLHSLSKIEFSESIFQESRISGNVPEVMSPPVEIIKQMEITTPMSPGNKPEKPPVNQNKKQITLPMSPGNKPNKPSPNLNENLTKTPMSPGNKPTPVHKENNHKAPMSPGNKPSKPEVPNQENFDFFEFGSSSKIDVQPNPQPSGTQIVMTDGTSVPAPSSNFLTGFSLKSSLSKPTRIRFARYALGVFTVLMFLFMLKLFAEMSNPTVRMSSNRIRFMSSHRHHHRV
jgi:hypothetical protein